MAGRNGHGSCMGNAVAWGMQKHRLIVVLALVVGCGAAADDVADAVLYLSSSMSDLVQGETLTVDGGAAIHV